MSTIFYAPGTGGYFADRFPAEPGKTVVLFAHSPDGFSVRVPEGIDWADYEEQGPDEEGNPRPPIRHPRDPWTYYQQTYPETVGSAAQPDAEEANSWQPPEPEPAPETPVTDVERAAAALAARRRTREDVIFSDTAGLVATCYAWLQRECAVPGGGTDTKTASQALQAGQGLCSTQGYGLALRAWIDFAASDFYTALSSPDATRPWLEWVPAGEPKSIREAILDRVYLATYGVPRP